MEQKENQRIALTKRMLKDSLLELMEEKSIQKISVSELCRKAGINRATFYNHYTMPQDILREMGDELAEQIQSLLKKKNLFNKGSLQEKVEVVCEYLQENRRIAKLLFQNNTPESEFAVRLFQIPDTWSQVCTELSDLYGEEGKDLLLTLFIHGLYCMITKWLLGGSKKTPKEMGTLIGGLHINGIAI